MRFSSIRGFSRWGVLPLLAVSSQAIAVSPAGQLVRPEWYSYAAKNSTEMYQWQSNIKFSEALAYTVSSMIFDANRLACANPNDPSTCYDFMYRCPKPKMGTSGLDKGGLGTFLSNFSPYNYCASSTDVTNNEQRAEMTGEMPASVLTSPAFQKFMTSGSTSAYLQDSYAILPRQMRRQILGLTKQMWSGISCPSFKAQENIPLGTGTNPNPRTVQSPALIYDCAYRTLKKDSSGNYVDAVAPTSGVSFVPRDRGNQLQTCVLDTTIFFSGDNCTGQAFVYIPDSRNELGFYKTRPSTSAENMIRSDISFATVSALPNQQKAAYFTEVLDRTVYYSYLDEPYRRVVAFDAGAAVVPYADATQIKSFYGDNLNAGNAAKIPSSSSPLARRCVQAIKGGTPNIPTGAAKYGYLDRLAGSVSEYSGLMVRQYRDNHMSPAGMTAGQKKAFLKNQIPNFRALAYDPSAMPPPSPSPSASPSTSPTPSPSTSPSPSPSTSPTPSPSPSPPPTDPKTLALSNRYPILTYKKLCPTQMYNQASAPPCTGQTDAVAYPTEDNVAIQEWWSDDPFADRSGTAQATMCGVGEYLLSLGRNSKTFSTLANPGVDTQRYCVRYLISKQVRTDDSGKTATGDAGNPLPDMAALSRGPVGGAVICENDPVIMARASEYRVYKWSPTTNTIVLDYDYSSAFTTPDHTMIPNFKDRDSSHTTYNNSVTSSAVILDDASYFDQSFAGKKSVFPIPFRSLGLGNPYAYSTLMPMNYARCAVLKREPEHPQYPMGPMALPLKNYVIELLERNRDLSTVPTGTPPHCP